METEIAELDRKVMQAISRVSHRPVEKLSENLRLREDLGLDSLNLMELEYEIQQGGFPDLELENLTGVSTISDVIAYLRKQ